jgi:translation initiation factor IF-2
LKRKVFEYAKDFGVSSKDLLKALHELGSDAKSAISWVDEEDVQMAVELMKKEKEVEVLDSMVRRPPVVTVMGHVDHGKTTLLDYVRKTNVAEREKGGITQHIGASVVTVPGHGDIVFIDTPGHEAFTAMRARGAQVTDIVVLVVAADDGVMPQTIEAINHAKAAGVPIIVAINKMDKPEANPEMVMGQLSDLGLVPEQWGGDTICVPISAKTGEGVDELLEMILLQAGMMELVADPNRPAKGRVIEVRMDKGKGPVASVIVQEGRLKVGDPFVVGDTWGKVRSLITDKGERIAEAGPSYPVEIVGLDELPNVGDLLEVVGDEKEARRISEERKEAKRAAAMVGGPPRISLEEFLTRISAEEKKELRIILKADVQGTCEAIKGVLERFSGEEVKVRIIHAGVGNVTESDCLLAGTSGAMIIGFRVKVDGKAAMAAERDGIEIRLYDVIFDLITDMKSIVSGMLPPETREEIVGRAEVRETFSIPGVGIVAGCLVKEGAIARGGKVRIIRNDQVIYDGRISSLKRFREDVREVAEGFECGVGIEGFQDIRVGDIIEHYREEKVARKLE